MGCDYIIKVKNLTKMFYSKNGTTDVLYNINLNIVKGEIISIIGPSGCGKSTLLDIISNLEKPTTGLIETNGKVGYMFQKDNLLNWLTVLENVLISVKANRKVTEKDIKKAEELLKKYNLYDFKDFYPNKISGGMKQRVSLIRSLMLNPDILLLDEPFVGLDYQTKILVIDDIYKIIKEENKTVILVTHDISEAISFSNTVYLLKNRPSTITNQYKIYFENGKSFK